MKLLINYQPVYSKLGLDSRTRQPTNYQPLIKSLSSKLELDPKINLDELVKDCKRFIKNCNTLAILIDILTELSGSSYDRHTYYAERLLDYGSLVFLKILESMRIDTRA